MCTLFGLPTYVCTFCVGYLRVCTPCLGCYMCVLLWVTLCYIVYCCTGTLFCLHEKIMLEQGGQVWQGGGGGKCCLFDALAVCTVGMALALAGGPHGPRHTPCLHTHVQATLLACLEGGYITKQA